MAVRNAAVWNGAAQDLGSDQVNVNAGSAAAPGLVFGNQADTGLFSSGGSISVSVDGVSFMEMNPGKLTLNLNSSPPGGGWGSSPYQALDVTAANYLGNAADFGNGAAFCNGLKLQVSQIDNDSHSVIGGYFEPKVDATADTESADVSQLIGVRTKCVTGEDSGDTEHAVATSAINFYASAPDGDNVTQVIGLYIEDLSGYTVNYAILTTGSSPSIFGGSVQIGTGSGNILNCSGTHVLGICEGTAPTTTLTDMCQIYTESGDLYCRTAAGNVVRLTGAAPPQNALTRVSGETAPTVIKTGMVVYSSSDTAVKRSKADSTTTKDSIGFSITVGDVSAGGTIAVQTSEIVTLANWQHAAETLGTDVILNGSNYELIPGKVYYCSAVSDGKITITPPAIQAPVGLALSKTEMLVYTSLAQVVAATPSVSTTRPNSLINGGFDFFQRTNPAVETARADNTYGPDRWVVLTDGGSTDIKISRTTGSTNARNAGRLKQTNASAKKFAIAQVIETDNTYPFRTKEARFQVAVKASTSTDVRIAVLEWTGTADTLASARDVVNNWANSADANPATTFFKSTTVNVLGHAKATIGTSFQQLGVNVNVGASANNLIVVVWTEDTVAQNVTLDVTEAGLYVGTTAPVIWTPLTISEEISRVSRYYQKSYNIDVAPATQDGSGLTPPYAPFDADNLVGVRYLHNMRTTPTVSIYSYLGTANKVSVWNTGADYHASQTIDSIQFASQCGFMYIQSVGDFDYTTPKFYYYHYTADAEL